MSSGEQVLQLFGFQDANPGLEILGVGLGTIIYRLLAWALLKAVRTHWSEVGGNIKARMSKKA